IIDIRFPLRGPNDERMLGGIAVDITSQLTRKKRIEVYASIVELSPDAIYSIDESGRILTWNPAAEQMFDYTQKEMIGQSIKAIVPADKENELEAMIESFRVDPAVSQQFETVRKGKDLTRKSVLVAAACIPDVEGASMTIAIVTRDVSQKKRFEEQIESLHDNLETKVQELSSMNISLQKARDEALESASMKSAFVANISHELRSPLSGILGMSELLERESLDDDSRQLVVMLRESAQDLLQVVEDILDLAKLEAGKTTVEEEVFSVRELIHDCTDLFFAAVSARRLSWTSSVADDVPDLLRSDPSIIRQVLSNLIANAVKFTEHGGITLSVSASPVGDSQLELKFSVTDTGVGIASDVLPSLFTPFA
ncbi:MAG: two-component system sensor histidine kinase NtrB, partial [Terriglobales bacterium]